jgi:hypothetical protein
MADTDKNSIARVNLIEDQSHAIIVSKERRSEYPDYRSVNRVSCLPKHRFQVRVTGKFRFPITENMLPQGLLFGFFRYCTNESKQCV